MRNLLGLALLAVASVLGACGGGEPQRCPEPVRVQLFGDSTQWGYLAGGGGVRAAEYPELVLQRLMDDRFGGGCVQVSTRAVSGTTSSQLVAGQDGLNLPWPRSVDADIVVVNHGINDVAWGVAPATYADNLRKLSRAQGAQVVFQTPLPVSTSSVDYTPEMVAVANEAGLQVIGARAYAQGLPNWWRYATDGVHGTSEGYRLLMTNAAMPVLESVVVRVMKAKPDRFSFNP